MLRVITWVGSSVRGSSHGWGHVFVGHCMGGVMHGVTHLITGPPILGRVPHVQNSFVRQGFCGWPGRVNATFRISRPRSTYFDFSGFCGFQEARHFKRLFSEGVRVIPVRCRILKSETNAPSWRAFLCTLYTETPERAF